MTEAALLSLLLSVPMPLMVPDAPKIDLTYQPCVEMYQAALKSGRQSDMRRVQNLCGIRTDSKESEQ